MKLTRKNNLIIIISILSVVILAISAFVLTSSNHKFLDRLSKKEISALREQYPIYIYQVPDSVSYNPKTFEDIIAYMAEEDYGDFIHGKVIGDVKYYTQKISTGDEALDKKMESNGISNDYKFYKFTVEIINSSNNKFQKGDHIVIWDSLYLKDSHPTVYDGLEIVLPVFEDRQDETVTEFSYTHSAMYYITKDGYAISAFDENTSSKHRLSGVKADVLMDELDSLMAKAKKETAIK